MGVIKYVLPPVLEDKEIWAQNQAKNEEQKCLKDEKKAKKAEALAKRRHEAEKAGLPEPESSKASVLEIERGEDSHWLNELPEEEEEEVPPTSGRTGAPNGGSQISGGTEGAPYINVD